MKEKTKEILLTIVTVILAIFLTFLTQNQLPMLDFLTLGTSLVRWGYFLIFYVIYFYVVSKIIFLLKVRGGIIMSCNIQVLSDESNWTADQIISKKEVLEEDFLVNI